MGVQPPERPKSLAKRLSPRLKTLLEDVARTFHLEPADVLGPRRLKSLADARHVVAWAIRKSWVPCPSFPEIGRMLHRDHTTIMAAVKRIDREVAKGSALGQIALKIVEPSKGNG